MKQKLAERIAEELTRDILRGRNLQPGDKLPQVREMAKLANTSVMTITESLSILEERGVLERIQGSGVYVRQSFMQLPPRNSNQIAVISHRHPDSHPLAHDLMQGILLECERLQLAVQGDYFPADYDEERATIEKALSRGAGGVVLYPTSRTRGQLRQDHLAEEFPGVPIILVDLAYIQQGRSAVVFDNFAAGEEMTRRLLGMGFEDVCFAKLQTEGHKLCHKSNEDRFDGYMRAMRIAEKDIQTLDLLEGRRIAENSAKTEAWMAGLDKPSALVAIDDLHARLAWQIAEGLGLKIPDDFLAVGFDDLAEFQKPYAGRIPTTAANFEDAGRLAVDLLLRLMENPSMPPFHYMLPAPVLWPRELGKAKARTKARAKSLHKNKVRV